MIRRWRMPLLWVRQLEIGARLRRLANPSIRAVLLIVAMGIGVALTLSTAMIPTGRAARFWSLLAQHDGLLIAAVAVYGCLWGRRRWHELSDEFHRSWLAPLPFTKSSVRFSVAADFALACATRLILVAVMLSLLAVAARHLDELMTRLVLAVVAFTAGTTLGGCWPVRVKVRREDSRYVPRVGPASVLSSDALSRWTVAQALAWQRPENSRIAVVVALMAVQGGSSVTQGLAVVGAWLLAVYLVSLVQATIHVGRLASVWLRSAPIDFANFAWPLARRAMSHQAIGAALAAAGFVALGMPALTALYAWVTWLTLVSCISAVSLADSYRGCRSNMKLVGVGTAMLAIELRQPYGTIPLAVLLALWHVRRAKGAG